RFWERDADPKKFILSETDRILNIWSAIQKQTNASIIQTNFVLPHERLYGNHDAANPISFQSSISQINRVISETILSQQGIYFNDLEYIASYYGKKNWFDEKLWIQFKYPCSLDLLPHLAQSLVDSVLSLNGFGVKCIVLDLDNTLWGGIIGEEGLSNIRLGHLRDGESFQLFQKYLLALKNRGIILTVCSKNEIETALLPFREHPDMILKEDDITLFIANWESKVKNIQKIKETINIGYDSIIFLDDSPFERSLVKDNLPDVIVPDLPTDPSNYIKTLSELNLFESAVISTAESTRTQWYRDEFKRRSHEDNFINHDDYLKSLEMKITLARFDNFQIPRIVELLQRSNQYNLMTKRFNESECVKFMNSPEYLPFYIELTDKYGDNGLISVVILKLESRKIKILEWAMSCRVLNRGVEKQAMNSIFTLAKTKQAAHVSGEYIPTLKNALVKNFYKEFGFEQMEFSDGKSQTWELPCQKYIPKRVFFQTATVKI
ncbi:MAG: FkbH domain-containing protein, partial [Candidatus Omnitrophica bacterium CG12_big_fil_rev_8_21_14_0_65_45_16]